MQQGSHVRYQCLPLSCLQGKELLYLHLHLHLLLKARQGNCAGRKVSLNIKHGPTW
jgi:hypothetical protein